MNNDWKKKVVIQRGDTKLSDIVYGRLTPQQKDMTEWHFDHPTPYYLSKAKENPYGTEQHEQPSR